MKYFWQSHKNFLQGLPFYRFHNNFMKIQNVPVLPNLKFDQTDSNCIRKYHVCNIRSKQEHVLFYIAFLQICKQLFMVSKTVFGPKLLSKNTKQVIAASQIFFFQLQLDKHTVNCRKSDLWFCLFICFQFVQCSRCELRLGKIVTDFLFSKVVIKDDYRLAVSGVRCLSP